MEIMQQSNGLLKIDYSIICPVVILDNRKNYWPAIKMIPIQVRIA